MITKIGSFPQKNKYCIFNPRLLLNSLQGCSLAQRKSIHCITQIINQSQTAQEQKATQTWLLYALIILSMEIIAALERGLGTSWNFP